MTWVKCPACEEGKMKKFWGNPQDEPIECPVCKGKQSVGIILAMDFATGWMGKNPMHDQIVKFNRKEPLDIPLEELAKHLAYLTEGYWKKMLIMADVVGDARAEDEKWKI